MIKILIVEDEEPIANLIRMNLVKAGYQCEIASDGELAADAISERSFDLILLDIMLPKRMATRYWNMRKAWILRSFS